MADRIHDAFDSVKAEPQLKEATKQFLSQERAKRTKHSKRQAFQVKLAAACLALTLALGIGGYTWIQTPVSYVGIDVNPSIELALNRLNRIVSVKGYNEEAEEILKGLSLKGKGYREAIDAIIGSDEMEVYLTDESELVFTVAADSGREDELTSGIESCMGHSGHASTNVSMDVEDVTKAHSHGISLGKYHAWMKLNQYEEAVTIDECKDMSMSEIHDRIHEHENGEHGHDNDYDHDMEDDTGDVTEGEDGTEDGHHTETGHGSGHHRE